MPTLTGPWKQIAPMLHALLAAGYDCRERSTGGEADRTAVVEIKHMSERSHVPA